MSEKARVAETPDTDPRGDDDSAAETSVTVEVDADVSAASDAIEDLQTDVDALTDELNEAAERVEDINIGSLDYGTPAPSPADVQAEMGEPETSDTGSDDHAERSSASRSTPSETNDREMVPAEPLYELAEMFQSLPVLVRGYKKGKSDAGEQLEDKLDALTEENAEETSATNTSSETMGETDE